MRSGLISSPADRAVRFINNLTLTEDYVGQPFRLRPWQEEIVRQLFGTLDEAGRRVYTEALLFLPRKQGKTELSAGIGLHGILGIGKGGQECLVGASDRKQASHLFKKAVAIVEADPYLDKRCKIFRSAKIIEDRKTGNTLEVISADARRQHGHNPSLAIIDELHCQPNRELYDALKLSFGARKEKLLLSISTAGNVRDSLIHEQYEYACGVRDGRIVNPHYLPIIFEAAPDADWTDEAVWHGAMPALGDFCELDTIREKFAKAKEIPAEESAFRQYCLNQWVASERKWLNREKWDLCGTHGFDPAELAGRPCYAGLDMSSTRDVTAFVLVFPMEDGTYRVLCYFWIPRVEAEERDRKGRTKYKAWERAGLVTLTDGDEIDDDLILTTILGRHGVEGEEDVEGIRDLYDIRKIIADPWNSSRICRLLRDGGLDTAMMQQGTVSMNEPTKYLDKTISGGKLHHGDNPVLNWMADNAVSYTDGYGNIKLDKKKSVDKIDGMIALVMGLAAAAVLAPTPTPDVFLIGPDA